MQMMLGFGIAWACTGFTHTFLKHVLRIPLQEGYSRGCVYSMVFPKGNEMSHPGTADAGPNILPRFITKGPFLISKLALGNQFSLICNPGKNVIPGLRIGFPMAT